ncbi:MAG TPA: hypothetical protein VFV38_08930 [Ktedonobacteraceae bacterium]|nr:hypothetical protein [Ktedonobacteraceae bacterium]
MTISQPTTSPFETTREAEIHEQAQGVGAVRDTALGAIEDLPTERNGSHDHPLETPPPSEPTRRPINYPEWPTSRPGPQITAPLPGQHPHPRRTDQMVYACYDQERGMPCVAPPKPKIIQQHRGRQYLPDTSAQETADEAQAIERWLNDGGVDVPGVRTTGALKASRNQ